MSNRTINTLSGSLAPVNAQLEKLQANIEDKLDRIPDSGQMNALEDTLDANNNKIINLGAPENPNDAARLKDIVENQAQIDGIQSKLNTIESGAQVNKVSSVNGQIGDVSIPTGISDSVVTVKDFGAVGDGVTDDTAALNAAFLAGGEIVVPEGEYIFSDTLRMTTSGTKIVGREGAVLKLKNSVGSLSTGSMVSDLGVNGQDLSILNLTIDANFTNNSGITGNNTVLNIAFLENLKLKNVTVKDAPESGMWLIDCVDFEVEGCRVIGHGALGIGARSTAQGACSNGRISGCFVDGVGRGIVGLHNFAAVDTTWVGNTSTDNFDRKANGDGAGIEVTANGQGDPSSRVTISGNNCFNNETGIRCEQNTQHVSITGNVCTQANAAGVVIFTGRYITVTGNSIYDCKFGIQIKEQSQFLSPQGISVVGNNIQDSESWGILLQGLSYSVISSNSLFNSGVTGGGVAKGGIGIFQGDQGTNTNNVLIDGNLFRGGDNGIFCVDSNQQLIDVTRNNLSGFTGDIITGFDFQRNRIGDNRGFTTRQFGTATIPSGAGSVVVAHGLDVNPQQGQINVTPNNNTSSDWWISSVTATTFTINLGSVAVGDKFFYWNVNAED